MSTLPRTSLDDVLDLGVPPIEAVAGWGRQRQAMRGLVRGAGADHHALEPTRQPTGLRPGGMRPSDPQGLAMAAAGLLEPADDRPAIVS
jgi:hypothetical protein